MGYDDELKKGFTRLAEIAKEAGCEDYVEEECAKVRKVFGKGILRIIVTGGPNTGKSALINRMIDAEIAEESMIADMDSLPLRVCFERTPDDEKYICANFISGAWNDIGAEIYELHLRDIKDQAMLDDKDFVLFVISAATPFSNTDTTALKALSDFPRQLVLSGMNYVQPKEREKVIDYVKKINDSLGLPPVVVFEDSREQDIGRVIRSLLPAPNMLAKLKEDHARAIFTRAINAVCSALEQAVKDSELNDEKAAAAKERSAILRAGWGNLYTGTMNMQNKAAEVITRNITQEIREIMRSLMDDGRSKKYSNAWIASLKDEVPQRVAKFINQRQDSLDEIYVKDLRKTVSDALFMKLDGFKFDDVPRITRGEKSVRFDSSVNLRGRNYTSIIEAGVAVAVITGACLFSRIPVTAKILGSALALAGGTFFAEKRHTSGRAAKVEHKLDSQIAIIATDIEASLRKSAHERYEPLISYIRQEYNKAGSVSEILSTSSQHREYLKGLILECNNMKGE